VGKSWGWELKVFVLISTLILITLVALGQSFTLGFSLDIGTLK
jgi:hypothetical protein